MNKQAKRTKHRSNERRMAFAILVVAAMSAFILTMVFLFSSKEQSIRLVGGKTIYYADNAVYEADGEPLMCHGKVYIPAESILRQAGFSTYYVPEMSAVGVSDRDGTSYIYFNSNKITYLGENVSFSDRTFLANDILYITTDMFELFSKDKISFEGELRQFDLQQ